MEEFVRQKVAVGDYETASEVVREGLRLLKQRDNVWKAEVRSKIQLYWPSYLAIESCANVRYLSISAGSSTSTSAIT